MEAVGVKAPAASLTDPSDFYLSGEDIRLYKRGIDQYPARLSGGEICILLLSEVGRDPLIDITFRFTFAVPEQKPHMPGLAGMPGDSARYCCPFGASGVK